MYSVQTDVLHFILFGAMPYILLSICVVGAIWRYTSNRYSWSSQSSQVLENSVLFYGSFPWHYGILIILVMHIFGLFFPRAILAWNGVPLRLYILELSGLALGFLAFFGLLVFTYRRLTDVRFKADYKGAYLQCHDIHCVDPVHKTCTFLSHQTIYISMEALSGCQVVQE